MEQLDIPVPQPPPQIQFGLKTILAITTGFAVLFASGYWFGVVGYFGFFVIAAFMALFSPRIRLGEKLIIGCIIVVVLALLLPTLQDEGTPRRRSQCSNNLKRIGLALQNYNDVFKRFPAACITDENGKPMHSWRVSILGFMEQKPLFDRYDFNEPWDGPNNSKLAKEMPAAFRCPNDKANPGTLTDYVAIVGPETIWQPNHGTTFKEISDGSSQTIAVVEASGARINWMEPRDLPFSAVSKGINPKQGVGMSSQHPRAVIAVFADGHTQTILETISPETLKALFTKAGGETIDEDY
ncbi:MAG TPA: DUF1559 domain-containing protein [Pirellulales bacterium]|jgi:hypothetical protein|nr:DUF1559 domain-containing protein [Pirellulales bacterium]